MNNLFQSLFVKENRWQVWFWILILFLAPLEAVLGKGDIIEASVFRFFGLISKMMAAYLLAYYIVPKLLFRKRYLLFFVSFAVSAILLCIIARILNVHIAERILMPELPRESIGEIITDISFTFGFYFSRVYSIALWFLFVKFGTDQLNSEQKLAKLRQEKAEAELNFLKAQIHPHFLFNTLNNLYTLTLEKSDEAPEVVIKLSEMLDYLLYQCNSDKVSIKKEIGLINNYIGLESLRYGERLNLSFNHQLDDDTATISPLLLLSPIENAFKHGTSGVTNAPSIAIDLTVRENNLHLRVQNTKAITPPTDERNYTAGIGIKNISSQLALTYPNRHQLEIQDEGDNYVVDLHIQL